MKPSFIALIIIFCLLFVAVYITCTMPVLQTRNFLVKATYCDNREPKEVVINWDNFPYGDQLLIQKNDKGVPVWKDETNVCSVEVVGELRYNQ